MVRVYLFDPEEPGTLRAEASALIEQLSGAIKRLENGALKFDEVEELYRSEQQPKAAGLVRAMLPHVPDEDPRLMNVSRAGNFRAFSSDDVAMVEESLTVGTAATQLKMVRRSLEELIDYLPK